MAYSNGCHVIIQALNDLHYLNLLAVEEGREARLLVQNVVLIGAPLECASRRAIEDMYDVKRHVVVGRFINVYS